MTIPRQNFGSFKMGEQISFRSSQKLVKKTAFYIGALSILSAAIHAYLWWSMKLEYTSFVESVLSPDGNFLYPEMALTWCLVSLIIAGAAGVYIGVRNIDVFNLPETWRRWDMVFVIWMSFCAVAPFALGVKIRLSEDGILEWFTFWADGIAGLIVAFIAISTRSRVLAIVAVALIVLAGEEISWGQRVFGIVTPEGLGHLNHANEINLHNLVPVLNLGYLLLFTLAALVALEIRGILGSSLARRLLRANERGLLIDAVDLPVFAAILFSIGLLAGYTDELAEYLFACCALAVSIRLLFIAIAQARKTIPTDTGRSDK